MASANAIEVLRGQSYSRQFTFTKEDGTAFNLTGQTVYFRLFSPVDPNTHLLDYDSVAEATKVVVVSAAGGVVRVDLAPADTNRTARVYEYSMFALDVAGKKMALVDPEVFVVREGGIL